MENPEPLEDPLARLTEDERKVVDLICRAWNEKQEYITATEIADVLGGKEDAIRRRLTSIYKKLAIEGNEQEKRVKLIINFCLKQVEDPLLPLEVPPDETGELTEPVPDDELDVFRDFFQTKSEESAESIPEGEVPSEPITDGEQNKLSEFTPAESAEPDEQTPVDTEPSGPPPAPPPPNITIQPPGGRRNWRIIAQRVGLILVVLLVIGVLGFIIFNRNPPGTPSQTEAPGSSSSPPEVEETPPPSPTNIGAEEIEQAPQSIPSNTPAPTSTDTPVPTATITAVPSSTPTPPADIISSFDNTSTEGWEVTHDSIVNPGASGNTGNSEDGYIRWEETSTDGFTSWFVASSKFSRDWRIYKELRLDMWSAGGKYMEGRGTPGDINISKGTLNAWYSLPYRAPDDGWETFVVPLIDDGLWNFGPGTMNLESVLVNITEFKIRAEYGDGTDQTGLDNITLVLSP